MIPTSNKEYYLWAGMIAIVLLALFLAIKLGNKSIEITNTRGRGNPELLEVSQEKKSLLTGTECESYDARPIAVMLSSDDEARPLSGIGEADMVFEMPVVDTGFTRMMAVYQCGEPKELGSIRSSRMDFVPLALGLDAIYAHFGGEREVLQELRSGIIDNIDGLRYDGEYYYRKSGIKRPHNAFTSSALLGRAISAFGYKTSGNTVNYPHENKSKSQGELSPPPVFAKDYRVIWEYNKSANSYSRSRSGKPEIDKNTGKQVEAKNVVIMKTTWTRINKDYIRVTTVGSGPAIVYKNGIAVSGKWEKKNDKAKLYFYDEGGKEIEFAAGNVWIEIITN